MAKIDLTGRQYGRWTVVGHPKYVKGPHLHWACRCECGEERFVAGPSLRSGISRSCGCLKDEKTRTRRTSHGMSAHPAYSSWSAMKKRCNNPSDRYFKDYGGRGIKVSPAWTTFEGFWADMGTTWAPGLTIERNDYNGDYCAENCCWKTVKEQASNRRTNVFVDTPWGRMTQTQAAERSRLPLWTIISRRKRGLSGEALVAPR